MVPSNEDMREARLRKEERKPKGIPTRSVVITVKAGSEEYHAFVINEAGISFQVHSIDSMVVEDFVEKLQRLRGGER